jgi:hypothetical protein
MLDVSMVIFKNHLSMHAPLMATSVCDPGLKVEEEEMGIVYWPNDMQLF